jgi:hypothetical protein
MIERDCSYSPDVEVAHDGRITYARDIAEGERIAIPMHMIEQISRQRSPRA